MGLSASAPWAAYYGNTPVSLSYPHVTIYEMLAATAKKHSDLPAYIFMGKQKILSH